MCLDSIKIPKRRGKVLKRAAKDVAAEAVAGKQYRYRVRGTRTSSLVNKAISTPVN